MNRATPLKMLDPSRGPDDSDRLEDEVERMALAEATASVSAQHPDEYITQLEARVMAAKADLEDDQQRLSELLKHVTAMVSTREELKATAARIDRLISQLRS